MSMQFRYKLAKETFKGKKVPPKQDLNEDHISADQRGNKSFVKKVREVEGKIPPEREVHLLSLDRETKSKPEFNDTSEEMSRRDMFSFFRPNQEEEETSKPKKRFKKKKRNRSKAPTAETTIEQSQIVESTSTPKTVKISILQPGLLIRFWNWLKFLFTSSQKPKLPESIETDHGVDVAKEESIPGEATAAETIFNPETTTKKSHATEESGELSTETVVQVHMVETEEEKEKKQIDIQKTVEQDLEQQRNEDEEELEDPDDKVVNRRNLMRQGLHFLVKPAVDNISEKIETVNKSIDQITKRKALIRPPGAITEQSFLQACTRCDACIHACPKDCIKRAPKSFGFLIMGTPYIEPIKNPCVMCNDLHCIAACEDGALKPVQDIYDVSMGYAILDKKHCKAYSNSYCQQCVIDCPIPGAITQDKDMHPIFHKDICTGCGVCARSCHTVNTPVAVKIKPQMVIDNQKLKQKIAMEKEENTLAEKAGATAEAAAEAAAKFLDIGNDGEEEEK